MKYDKMAEPPVLSDLGATIYGKERYTGVVQPVAYRAPEVCLGMEWNSAVDIWMLGVIVSRCYAIIQPCD